MREWDWRGDAAPPFEPPASRAAAGAPDDRGRNPRTRARTAQRRTAVVAADLTQAEQVALDQAAEALRLPDAGEPAHEAVNGVRELSPGLSGVPIEGRAAYGGSAGRLDPPQARPEAFPQGFIAPQARAASDPEPRNEVLAQVGTPGP